MIQNARSCPAIWITVKCCCPLIKSVKCTLDNSKYTRYNIWPQIRKIGQLYCIKKLKLNIQLSKLLKPSDQRIGQIILISFIYSEVPNKRACSLKYTASMLVYLVLESSWYFATANQSPTKQVKLRPFFSHLRGHSGFTKYVDQISPTYLDTI